MLLGLVYAYLPFMVLPLYATLERIDPSLLEAAADLGDASVARCFPHCCCRLTTPGMIAGSILVFIPCLGAYLTPDLLGGGKTVMTGNLIQNQFTTARDWPFGSAVSLVLMVIVMLLLAVLIRRSGDGSCYEARSYAVCGRWHSLSCICRSLVLVVFSFNRSRFTVWEGFSLNWYRAVLNNGDLAWVTRNSVIIAIVVSDALHCNRHDGGVRTVEAQVAVLAGSLYLSLVTPEIVTGISLLAFFQFIFRYLHLQLGLYTVILAHVAFSISYVAIVVSARLRSMDRALEEAALDLGAHEWTRFLRVTLPNLMPGVIAAALLALIVSFDDYVITSLVAGVDSETLPMMIYAMARRGVNPEINAISAMIVVLFGALIMVSEKVRSA